MSLLPYAFCCITVFHFDGMAWYGMAVATVAAGRFSQTARLPLAGSWVDSSTGSAPPWMHPALSSECCMPLPLSWMRRMRRTRLQMPRLPTRAARGARCGAPLPGGCPLGALAALLGLPQAQHRGGGISCVMFCWPPSTSPACRMASSAAGASLAARPAALPAGSSRGAGGTAPRRPAAWPRGRSQR